MDHRITATDLARRLGDILGRIRYRRDRFVVEKHGMPVAVLTPPPQPCTVGEALAAWRGARAPDAGLARALERVGAADRPPRNPWAS